MAPDIIERWKASAFVYRSYHLPMLDPNLSTLTVLNSNFLQLGRRSGGRPQRTVYPRRLPVNTVNVIHTTLADLEPTTFRLLVRHAASSATDSLLQQP